MAERASRTIELLDGTTIRVNRAQVKNEMERFGKVEICNMGLQWKLQDLTKDPPFITFESVIGADKAMEAIEAGMLFIGGFQIRARRRAAGKGGGKGGGGGGGGKGKSSQMSMRSYGDDGGRKNEGCGMTSRELMMTAISSNRRRSSSRSRSRRGKRMRMRSESRPRSPSRTRGNTKFSASRPPPALDYDRSRYDMGRRSPPRRSPPRRRSPSGKAPPRALRGPGPVEIAVRLRSGQTSSRTSLRDRGAGGFDKTTEDDDDDYPPRNDFQNFPRADYPRAGAQLALPAPLPPEAPPEMPPVPEQEEPDEEVEESEAVKAAKAAAMATNQVALAKEQEKKQEAAAEPAQPNWAATSLLNMQLLRNLALAQIGQGLNPLGQGLQSVSLNKIAEVDPGIRQLCTNFGIEDRMMYWLSGTMEKRRDTFNEDIERLWERLEHAKNPAGLLSSMIRDMEQDKFVSMLPEDSEIDHFAKKHKIDAMAKIKLSEFLSQREDTKTKDLGELDTRLEWSGTPSALLMFLIKKLQKGEPLPNAKQDIQPGSYLDRMEKSKRSQQANDKKRRESPQTQRYRSPSRGRGDDRGGRRGDDRGGRDDDAHRQRYRSPGREEEWGGRDDRNDRGGGRWRDRDDGGYGGAAAAGGGGGERYRDDGVFRDDRGGGRGGGRGRGDDYGGYRPAPEKDQWDQWDRRETNANGRDDQKVWRRD